MSFLIDIVLIGILVAVVAAYAKKSIFMSGVGTLVTAIAVVVSLYLVPFIAPTAAAYTVQPLTEQSIAGELADMHSAPHAATAEQMVASLPLETLITEQPEGYLQLLDKYGVTPEEVLSAYRAQPTSMTVVHTIASSYVTALTESVVFLLLAVVLTVLLQLIVRHIEQNLPPQRRYRGIKRMLPPLFGVLCGLVWSFVVVTVLSWTVPVMAGKLLFLTPAVLEKTDWYSLLNTLNPLPRLQQWI